MPNHKKTGYISVLKSERQYLKMIVANVVNRFGDSIDAVAFGWLVYQLTGSATWLTIIYGVNFIPTIFFQPLAGALVNFWDKKKLVVLCDMGRGLLVLLIGILFIIGWLTPWLLLIITFSNSCLEAIRMPCSMAIIPKILKKENYTTGVSFNQGASRVSELLGMGASGVIIATLGVGGALVVDAVTFILSGILLFFLKFKDEKTDVKSNHYLSELKGGFAYFLKNKAFIAIVIVCVLINITGVPWDSLKAAYISESLKLGAIALSVGGTLTTIGMIVGTFLYPFISKILSPKSIFVGGGTLLGALYFALVFSGMMPGESTKLIAYGASTLLFGIASAAIQMGLMVNLMAKAEPEYVSRVGSIFNASACSSLPVGSLITATVTPFFTVNQIYFAAGILTILIFTAANFTKTMKALNKT